ncbi:hypothetical protein HDU97_007855 [Phlyctochytrium planicorne]|nr:hypothetical protein HDU97_007855 [Phlyctochytrium planicorne]
MADDYEAFTGGGLKLKGLGVQKKKKKKTTKETIEKAIDTPTSTSTSSSTKSGPKMTPAELRFEEIRRKRQEEKAAKMAQKSHKERVAEFNNYLENLSEHHDIPKVGPG